MNATSLSIVLPMVLFLSAGSLHSERKEPVLGAEIISRLIAPETRTEAFREVQIAKQGENPRQDWRELPMAAFELYHQDILVTECPQLNGAPPLYMVSYLWDTSAFRRHYSPSRFGGSEGFAPVEDALKPAELVEPSGRFSNWAASAGNPHLSVPPPGRLGDRVIVFLTDQGKVVWPFQGDNLTEGDVFKDLNGDGRYERVYSSNFGVYDKREGEPDIWVQALRVEAVDPESTRLFYILLNWQSRKSEVSPAWGWAARDLDGDGLDEIVLGPIADEDAEPEVEVVYRWDTAQQRYVGPQGSHEDHYLLLDPEADLWDELRRVKAAGGMRYEAIARANAPAVEVAAPDAPYDWRRRDPYRHRSLAAASNEALLDFICGWSPVPKSGADGADAVAASSNHRFTFQADWAQLAPKAAAFAFVDSNQSHVHRNKYTLYYPTNLVQAEPADWVVLSFLTNPGIEVIRTSGGGTGRYIAANIFRPLPEKYPAGEFRWEWTSGRMHPDPVSWLQETLWWLAQIRSEAKVRERGYGMSASFSTNCFPTYMETAPPTVRLLRDGDASVIDIKAERAGGYASSWREAYGAEQYLGFADRLFQDNKGRLMSEKPRVMTVVEIFDAMPALVDDLPAGRIPPQLAKAMIRSAGDAGEVGLLPTLKEVQALIPEKTELELEWQRLQDQIDALPQNTDFQTYQAKVELETQMGAIDQSMRDNRWTWLREPLRFAIRQLEVADDLEALAAWAEQPGERGALWALARIKEIDVDAWRQVLTKVFLGQPEWRQKIISYLAYKDRELAEALVAKLPRPEQLALSPALQASREAAAMDEAAVEDLLATIRSDELDAKIRVGALRKLVPRREPHAIESVAVDQVLLDVLQQEMEPLREPWPERYLVYDAVLALLLRDKRPLPVNLYIKGAEARWNQFSFGSYLALVVHLAVVKESVEARDWLIQWGHDFIEQDAGAWSRFAEVVYAADLRQFGPFLERLATFDPQDVEGGSALGKGRHPELKHGGRYHRARQIAAVWSEPDALARVKCEMLLGLSFEHAFGVDGLYSPIRRSQDSLSERVGRLSAVQREAFVAFVDWCQEAIDTDRLHPAGRQYFAWISETYGQH